MDIINKPEFKNIIGKIAIVNLDKDNMDMRCSIENVRDNQIIVVSDGQHLYDVKPEDIKCIVDSDGSESKLSKENIDDNFSTPYNLETYISDSKDYEMVNHPTHYHPGDYEAIKVIKAWLGDEGCYNFCIANSIKYVSRLGFKPDNGISKEEKLIEDIDKAIWYLEYAKECKK